MTDDKKQPKVSGRPEHTEPEQGGQQTQQSQVRAPAQAGQQAQCNRPNTPTQPGPRTAPGRRPLFRN
jgi:hypothetical protein